MTSFSQKELGYIRRNFYKEYKKLGGDVSFDVYIRGLQLTNNIFKTFLSDLRLMQREKNK